MKRFWCFPALLLVAGLCFGTGAKESAKDAKQKITWWTIAVPENYRSATNQVFVDSFNKAHPSIELELKYMEDYERTIRTAVQAGAGPDIIQNGGPGYALEFWAAKQAADMRPLEKKYGWSKKILKWAYEAGLGKDGSLISLPVQYESMVLFYNKTLLNKLGLKAPQNGKELVNALQAAKANGKMSFAHFFQRNRWHFPAMWGGYAGNDLYYKAVIQEAKWDHPRFVEAMEAWNKQIQDGYWAKDLKTYYSLSQSDTNSALAQGEALMMINGTWNFKNMLTMFGQSKQEWEWTRVPTWRDSVEPVYDLSVGESICLNSKAASPEAAGEVIDWLFSNKQLAAQLAIVNDFSNWFIPLDFIAKDFEGKGVDPRILRWIDDFTTVTSTGKYGYPTWVYWPPKTKTWAEKELAKVHNGEMSAKEFMTKFQELYAVDYREANIPAPPKPNLRASD